MRGKKFNISNYFLKGQIFMTVFCLFVVSYDTFHEKYCE